MFLIINYFNSCNRHITKQFVFILLTAFAMKQSTIIRVRNSRYVATAIY